MLIHAMLPASRVNGPGLRAAVFFQGCSLGCPSCWNPQTHEFHGVDVPAAKVVADLLRHAQQVPLDGVTFSGGEPMQQAGELEPLLRELRSVLPGMSMGMFTGYSERELEEGSFDMRTPSNEEERRALWRSIRSHLDFAVMGRYNRLLPAIEPMRSSRNQTLRLLSARHRQSDFEAQSVEIVIDTGGLATVTGFPTLGMPV